MTHDAILEQHRTALTGHCYRMLGSLVDADDAVQETMFRAWKSLDRFAERSSIKTWLYRIATNVCLDMLSKRPPRMQPFDVAGAGTIHDDIVERPREHWVEPIPDAQALPADGDPGQRLLLRESIRLAFVAALQHLPPKQRAALLMTQVLDCSAAEAAECLDMTVASVNSALQRARATLAARDLDVLSPRTLSEPQTELLTRYVDAFERYDVPALTELLHEDATLNMPPIELWLRGHEAISGWMLGRGSGCCGSRLVPTMACGMPAFGQYRDGGAKPWSLIVLDIAGDRIAGITSFLDVDTLFPRFGLAPRLA
jgi:RNA polymerase sigma-70 factor, ECF subfamily